MPVYTKFQAPDERHPADFPLQVIEFAIMELVANFGGPSAASGPEAQAQIITRGARMTSGDTQLVAAIAAAVANRTCRPGECGTQNT